MGSEDRPWKPPAPGDGAALPLRGEHPRAAASWDLRPPRPGWGALVSTLLGRGGEGWATSRFLVGQCSGLATGRTRGPFPAVLSTSWAPNIHVFVPRGPRPGPVAGSTAPSLRLPSPDEGTRLAGLCGATSAPCIRLPVSTPRVHLPHPGPARETCPLEGSGLLPGLGCLLRAHRILATLGLCCAGPPGLALATKPALERVAEGDRASCGWSHSPKIRPPPNPGTMNVTPVWTQPTRAHRTQVTVDPSPSPQDWWPRIAASVCLRLCPGRTCDCCSPRAGTQAPRGGHAGSRGWAGNHAGAQGPLMWAASPGAAMGAAPADGGCFPGACRDSRQVFKRAGARGRGKFPAGTLGTRSEDRVSPVSVAGLLFGSHPLGNCLVLLISGTRRFTPTRVSLLPGI